MKSINYWLISAVFVSAYSSVAAADPVPEWVNSYSVDDTCYCAPNLSSSLSKKIVPTPVGGKSVAQICQRIGPGPELTLKDGEFNYPTYTDAQCGNGPAPLASAETEKDCEGRLFADDILCNGTGPAWDLKAAYATNKQVAKVARVTVDRTPSASGPALTQSDENEPETIKPAPKVRVVVKTEPVTTDSGQDTSTQSDNLPLATVIETNPVSDAAPEAHNKSAVTPPLATIIKTEPIGNTAAASASGEATPTPTIISARVGQASTPDKQSTTAAEAKVVRVETPVKPLRPQTPAKTTVAPSTQKDIIKTDNVGPTSKTDATATDDVDPANGWQRLPQTPSANSPADVSEQSVAETSNDLTSAKPESTTLTSEKNENTTTPERAVAATQKSTDDDQSADIVAESNASPSKAEAGLTALRISDFEESDNLGFNYFELAPSNYDFGGNGGAVEASYTAQHGWGLIGRASVLETYSEFMLGLAYRVQPSFLKGAVLSLSAGVESGSFDLGVTDYDDTGGVVSAMASYAFSPRVRAQGGVSYSSFFDGDPSLLGAVLVKLTPAIDVSGRVEVGDNDNVGVGLRFNY